MLQKVTAVNKNKTKRQKQISDRCVNIKTALVANKNKFSCEFMQIVIIFIYFHFQVTSSVYEVQDKTVPC